MDSETVLLQEKIPEAWAEECKFSFVYEIRLYRLKQKARIDSGLSAFILFITMLPINALNSAKKVYY